MDLTIKDIGAIIKKSWVILLALTIIGTVAGYGVSTYVMHKKYVASAMMIVSTTLYNQENNAESTMTLSDYNLNTKLVNSYSVLSKSDRVLSQVRDKLGMDIELDTLSSMISVSSKNDTDIISLSVTSTDPQLAQTIANTLVDVFKSEVSEIMKMDNVQIIDYATLPDTPVSPNVTTNMMIGGLVGLIAALIVSVLRYIMDDTIKDAGLIMELLDAPVIGNVPKLT